jgi:large subunit ribosomal protein L10
VDLVAVVLRAEKAELVDDLNAVFKGTSVVVVAHYSGLSVPEITELRASVRSAGGTFRVTKNRLTRRALDGTPYEGMAHLFKGPTAVAYSTADPAAVPKAIVQYARKNDKLVVTGGGLGRTLLDPEAVKALAELPSLDELRAGLIAMINTPATRLARLLGTPGGQLARVLKAHADKQAD